MTTKLTTKPPSLEEFIRFNEANKEAKDKDNYVLVSPEGKLYLATSRSSWRNKISNVLVSLARKSGFKDTKQSFKESSIEKKEENTLGYFKHAINDINNNTPCERRIILPKDTKKISLNMLNKFCKDIGDSADAYFLHYNAEKGTNRYSFSEVKYQNLVNNENRILANNRELLRQQGGGYLDNKLAKMMYLDLGIKVSEMSPDHFDTYAKIHNRLISALFTRADKTMSTQQIEDKATKLHKTLKLIAKDPDLAKQLNAYLEESTAALGDLVTNLGNPDGPDPKLVGTSAAHVNQINLLHQDLLNKFGDDRFLIQELIASRVFTNLRNTPAMAPTWNTLLDRIKTPEGQALLAELLSGLEDASKQMRKSSKSGKKSKELAKLISKSCSTVSIKYQLKMLRYQTLALAETQINLEPRSRSPRSTTTKTDNQELRQQTATSVCNFLTASIVPNEPPTGSS